mgnify:CR=1 FL=1
MNEETKRSCVDCGVYNCHTRDKEYPDFCLTTELTDEERAEVWKLYEEPENQKASVVSAQIESDFYLRYTRVQEIVAFAKRMGYHKIGIATCVGLIEESRIFARILRKNGFEVVGAVCKVGSFEKTKVGVPEEDTRLMLKTCYRQYQQYSKVQTMLKNNLISLLDTTFPDANRLFASPPRADGSEKWVDFVDAFWHCECVCGLSEKTFITRYQKWCRKHGYNFNENKALDIYASACGHFGVMPKTDTTKLLVEQAISQLRATSAALAALKQEMQSLAASLPEYPVVMGMFGVGPSLGPQLMAEIGDVRRFHSKKALVAFAGIDAPPYQSGQMDVRSRSISKRGSASLRRTLFLVMSVILQRAPMDEPVYQFMSKKHSEGKPYRVYMMASANKFLRIYYASVKAYLDSMEYD